jgi:hypothetical protein
VLGDEDAVAAFLHGECPGDLHRGVQVVFDGVRVVGGDFQNEVRVALDHRDLFLGGIRRDSRRAPTSGPGTPGAAESVVPEGVPGILCGAVAGRSVRRAGSAEVLPADL